MPESAHVSCGGEGIGTNFHIKCCERQLCWYYTGIIIIDTTTDCVSMRQWLSEECHEAITGFLRNDSVTPLASVGTF